MNTQEEATLVDLLPPNSVLARSKEPLVPTRSDEPLSICEINRNTGELLGCAVEFTLSLVETESYEEGLIQYSQLRLSKGKESKILHYIHYTGWKDSKTITVGNMKKLLEIVNKYQKGNAIFMNCLMGQGRTGTFDLAKRIKETGKAFFETPVPREDNNPIAHHIEKSRTVRCKMVDHESQFFFLHELANIIWEELYGRD